MINEKNVTYLYVGNVTNGIADNTELTPAVIDALPAGSVVIAEYTAGALTSGNPTSKEGEAIAAGGTYEIISKRGDGKVYPVAR